MKQKLELVGFEVAVKEELTAAEIRAEVHQAAKEFAQEDASVFLLYYSGHGNGSPKRIYGTDDQSIRVKDLMTSVMDGSQPRANAHEA